MIVTVIEINRPLVAITGTPAIAPKPVAVSVIPELTPKIPLIIPAMIEMPFFVFRALYFFLNFSSSSINFLITPS